MDELDLGATVKGFGPGQRVFGRYRLQRLLGRGGMGVVWLAQDEELEREVALKFLPEVVASDPEAIRDLKRETRRSLQLTHPHIIRIYDFAQDARLAAISMEFLDGATLTARKLEQANSRFEPREVADWVRQLLEALEYAHTRAQVVHRDLKPANLMVDRRGELKVSDFGIAASVSDSVSRVSAQAGSSGTPVYMSPQQMMGERPAVTDDIYAIGATLYDLLTGKPPFFSGNVMMQVQAKVPPPLSVRRREFGADPGDIPAAWEETIAACLAKEPADRPQSAAEVAERLQGAGQRARPAKAERRIAPTPTASAAAAPRNRHVLPLAIGLAVLMAAAGWYFLVHVPARQRAAEEARTLAASRERQEQERIERARQEELARSQAEQARESVRLAEEKARREELERLAAEEKGRRDEAERLAAEQRRRAEDQARAEALEQTRAALAASVTEVIRNYREAWDLDPARSEELERTVQAAASQLDDARRARIEQESRAALAAVTGLARRLEAAVANAEAAWRELERSAELLRAGAASEADFVGRMDAARGATRYLDPPSGREFLLTRHGLHAPATAPGHTAMLVILADSGVSLSLDGGPARNTAGVWRNLAPGIHRVTLEREGYSPLQREITLTPGEWHDWRARGEALTWTKVHREPTAEDRAAEFVAKLGGAEWKGKFGLIDPMGITIESQTKVVIRSYAAIGGLFIAYPASIQRVDSASQTIVARYETNWRGGWKAGDEFTLHLTDGGKLVYSTKFGSRSRTWTLSR